ncbi:hypothetical protein BH24BAC1_BH24BAC1_03310 [soil metagenome]|jgi:TonB family protein
MHVNSQIGGSKYHDSRQIEANPKPVLMKKQLLLFAFFFVYFPSFGQLKATEGYNQVDAAQRRQGPWKLYDNNLHLVLEGSFQDDQPVGVLHYYRNDALILELAYMENREKFLWTYHEGTKKVKGYSLLDKHRTQHFFENGQKLTANQILNILSNYETEVAFEGGHEGLRSFLAQNLKYPEKAKKKGIQGEVYASFVVDKTGAIRDLKIVRGVDENLDQEALRLIQQMPRWAPATFRGYPKETRHTLIIPFRQGEAVAGARE